MKAPEPTSETSRMPPVSGWPITMPADAEHQAQQDLQPTDGRSVRIDIAYPLTR